MPGSFPQGLKPTPFVGGPIGTDKSAPLQNAAALGLFLGVIEKQLQILRFALDDNAVVMSAGLVRPFAARINPCPFKACSKLNACSESSYSAWAGFIPRSPKARDRGHPTDLVPLIGTDKSVPFQSLVGIECLLGVECLLRIESLLGIELFVVVSLTRPNLFFAGQSG